VGFLTSNSTLCHWSAMGLMWALQACAGHAASASSVEPQYEQPTLPPWEPPAPPVTEQDPFEAEGEWAEDSPPGEPPDSSGTVQESSPDPPPEEPRSQTSP
jgi:hypothetical protein